MSRLLLLTLCLAASAFAQAPLTKAERKAGWVRLFDGKSMKGWLPAGDAWSIEDGCLKANRKQSVNEDLFTKRTYRDFELTFEWRISPGGNSGVKYRIQKHLFLVPASTMPGAPFEARVEQSFLTPVSVRPEKGQDYVIGFEYQMTDDAANPDALGNPRHTAGALYDMVIPASAAARPVGEFNQSRIFVQGNHVEHWLNGVKVVQSSLDSADALAGIGKRWAKSPHVRELLLKQPVKDCHISLQNHNDDAWFRNIRIRRLVSK